MVMLYMCEIDIKITTEQFINLVKYLSDGEIVKEDLKIILTTEYDEKGKNSIRIQKIRVRKTGENPVTYYEKYCNSTSVDNKCHAEIYLFDCEIIEDHETFMEDELVVIEPVEQLNDILQKSCRYSFVIPVWYNFKDIKESLYIVTSNIQQFIDKIKYYCDIEKVVIRKSE